jgi:large subunit ribosomal protein L6
MGQSERRGSGLQRHLGDLVATPRKPTHCISTSIAAMFAPARRSCVQRLATISPHVPESIPTCQTHAAACRGFATTSPCQSKIGSAPLSIPPSVTFTVQAPSARARASRVQAMSTVHIKGPLGELSMPIPSYVNINEDPALPGPTVSVQDATDAKQRAMWGAYPLHPSPPPR